MLELRPQPLDENVKINLLTKAQAIPESLQRQEWYSGCGACLGIELDIGKGNIIFPKVVVEQGQVRPEGRSGLFNPGT